MSRSKPRAFLDNAVLSRLGRLTLSARVPMLGSVTGIHKSAARGSSAAETVSRQGPSGVSISKSVMRRL